MQTIPDAFKKLNIPLALPGFHPLPDIKNGANLLKKRLEAVRPDVILSNGWTPFHQEMYYDVIKDYCKKHRAFHVYWSLEDPLHTETWSKYVVEKAAPDYIFTHEFGFAKEYEKLGIPSSYLPLACNPKRHHNRSTAKTYQYDISFVGNHHPRTHLDSYRLQCLKILLMPLVKRHHVAIWGKGWHNKPPIPIPQGLVKGPVSYKEVPKIYASSKITLGIQNSPNLLTRRTFECLGSGGLLLTRDTPAVRRHFTAGEQLAVSRNADETLLQVERYLQDAQARQSIADHGQKEVYKNHTYVQRIKEMVRVIEPYVKAKREHQVISPLPKHVKKEVRPECIVSKHNNGQCFKGDVTVRNRANRSASVFLTFNVNHEPRFSVTSARLKIFLAAPPIGKPLVQCYAVASTWRPDTLAKGTMPGLAAQTEDAVRVNPHFETDYPWAGNWHTFNLTSLVNAWLSGSRANNGICLLIPKEEYGQAVFFSRNRRGKWSNYIYRDRMLPRLDIDFETTTGKPLYTKWQPFEG